MKALQWIGIIGLAIGVALFELGIEKISEEQKRKREGGTRRTDLSVRPTTVLREARAPSPKRG